jgi:hypothetical protein
LLCVSVYDDNGRLFEKEVIIKLVLEIIKSYKKTKAKNSIFYIWYDAFVGHLRASTINNKFCPPFKCAVNFIKDFNVIIDDIYADISSLYRNGQLYVYVDDI